MINIHEIIGLDDDFDPIFSPSVFVIFGPLIVKKITQDPCEVWCGGDTTLFGLPCTIGPPPAQRPEKYDGVLFLRFLTTPTE